MNVDNVNTLIAHLEAQPPERINMGHGEVVEHPCGTCGCILGHAHLALPGLFQYAPHAAIFGVYFDISREEAFALTHPDGWRDEQDGVRRYPAHRVIATLKRLRDTYLATGQVVVDWGPEPDQGKPWSTPHVSEIIAPSLPAEITGLLLNAQTVEV